MVFDSLKMKIPTTIVVVLIYGITITQRIVQGENATSTRMTESESQEIIEEYKELGYHGLTPQDRMEEYQTDYHWPPQPNDFIPNTDGWRRLNERRFRQLALCDDHDDAYDGLMIAVHSALNTPNFTEFGWGLTRAPQHIIDKLEQYLHEGLEEMKNNPVYEKKIKAIRNYQNRPYFISIEDIEDQILTDLQPLHEAWSGVQLEGHNSYGLRVYREGSKLDMHVDTTETHIISSILHVGHSEDMESWPLVIEDFNGNTNEVHLEVGDLLFYESSKCLHGRPRQMKGKDSWYSSVFTHYTPIGWDGDDAKEQMHNRVPPIWDVPVPREEGDPEELKAAFLRLIEPSCEDEWCSLKNSVHVHGPAPGYGKVLGPGGQITDLKGIPEEDSFDTSIWDEL